MSEGGASVPDGAADGDEVGDGDEPATGDAGVAEADDGDDDGEGSTDDTGDGPGDDDDDGPVDPDPPAAEGIASPPQPAISTTIRAAPEMRRQAEVVIAAL